MPSNINLLLVEDNDDDAFFIERAFTSTDLPVHISRCIDGQDAINYLENEPPFQNKVFHPLPDVILLDLKLPVKPGLDVLAWIRDHPRLGSMIVIILTSSAEKNDIEKAYSLHANAYLTKPSSLQVMADLARAINLCWFQTCLRLLPTR